MRSLQGNAHVSAHSRSPFVKRVFPLLATALFLSVLTGSLAACGDGSSESPGGSGPAAAQLTVADPALTRLEDGTRLFTGKLYNPTDRALSRAQVQVTLLDAHNRRIGSMSVQVRDIAARDTTAFRQPVTGSSKDVSGARVRSITVL